VTPALRTYGALMVGTKRIFRYLPGRVACEPPEFRARDGEVALVQMICPVAFDWLGRPEACYVIQFEDGVEMSAYAHELEETAP
jgi:hypothetical protein